MTVRTAMEALACNVVRKRAELQLSQGNLAERADVARATVSKIEQGDGNVTIAKLQKIAQVLGCSVEQLFESRHLGADDAELERRATSEKGAFVDAHQLLDAIEEANAPRYSRSGRKRKVAR